MKAIVARLIRSRQIALPSRFDLVIGSTRYKGCRSFTLSIFNRILSIVNSARSIVLIGMMGAGKSSVGRCLQRRTGLARFDTDEIVSRNSACRFRKSFPRMVSNDFAKRKRKPRELITGSASDDHRDRWRNCACASENSRSLETAGRNRLARGGRRNTFRKSIA